LSDGKFKKKTRLRLLASGNSRLSAVVNYRVDYKQFVLWYCSEPKVTLHAIVYAERSLCFVIRQCSVNRITWYSVNITQQLRLMFVL